MRAQASPVIDFHTHAFTDALAPSAMASLVENSGIPAYYDGTISGLVRSMDAAGVDVSVIQPVATKPKQVVPINDWAASVASDRIVPFGAMHPDFPDPAAEMARMRGLGIRGIKMHTEYQAFAPDEPRLWPVYEAAVENDLVFLFHAGEDLGVPTLLGTAEAFAGMLDRFPGLCVVLAHMGGFRQWEAARDLLVGRNIYLDTAYTIGQLDDEAFLTMIREHGADRVLFGSDGPWTDSAAELAHIRSLPLAPREIDAITGGNAARLLAL
jgi:predicted TIM-barrel fold metal-dependent hydrolase